MHARTFLSTWCLVATCHLLTAQPGASPAEPVKMDKVIISDVSTSPDVFRLEAVQGTYLHAGKKSEVVDVVSLNANIAEKTGRQIFAKIPGVFVYDMDGAGNQINIAARGLDPHRGWEFNIRKDGIVTNSDMYGYPASHYSMPMESIERIALVRGTGSLQYGAQFGGMLNYISKGPDRSRPLAFETVNTIGSFGLRGTYNAIGGRVGKFSYYAYYNKRVSDGYQDNARTDSESMQVTAAFAPTDNLAIKAEWARSNYTYRIPGPLTDAMFKADPTQATRSRSYFNPDINVPSLSVDLKLPGQTHLSLTTSAVLGARNSVLFDRPANVVDAVDPVTGQPANRQIDIDRFNSYTTELRVLHPYRLLARTGTVVAGVQVMDNDLHRRQLGRGTTGSDFNLALVTPIWGRDLHLRTRNTAFFFENTLELVDRLTLNVGARVETGTSKMSGTISYLASEQVPNDIEHRFPLLGAGLEYRVGNRQNMYAGWSQSYRPVIFKDIIPASTYDRADKNLHDADGYNLEAGYRGEWQNFRWDVGLFYLRYNQRLGKLALTDPAGNFYIYQTNIGDSASRGVELFVEKDIPLAPRILLTLFTSSSHMSAHYRGARVAVGTVNRDISGNEVESAPRWTSRNGLTLKWHQASFSLLYSYVGATFADPLNTVTPSANGAVGRIPAYALLDLGVGWKARENLTFKFNASNVTDRQYFTKRPLFYPGPGIWPSDGRGFSLSAGLKL